SGAGEFRQAGDIQSQVPRAIGRQSGGEIRFASDMVQAIANLRRELADASARQLAAGRVGFTIHSQRTIDRDVLEAAERAVALEVNGEMSPSDTTRAVHLAGDLRSDGKCAVIVVVEDDAGDVAGGTREFAGRALSEGEGNSDGNGEAIVIDDFQKNVVVAGEVPQLRFRCDTRPQVETERGRNLGLRAAELQ